MNLNAKLNQTLIFHMTPWYQKIKRRYLNVSLPGSATSASRLCIHDWDCFIGNFFPSENISIRPFRISEHFPFSKGITTLNIWYNFNTNKVISYTLANLSLTKTLQQRTFKKLYNICTKACKVICQVLELSLEFISIWSLVSFILPPKDAFWEPLPGR